MFTRTRLTKEGDVIHEGNDRPVISEQDTANPATTVAGAINLALVLESGDYLLHVIVTDQGAGKKPNVSAQSVQFEIVQRSPRSLQSNTPQRLTQAAS